MNRWLAQTTFFLLFVLVFTSIGSATFALAQTPAIHPLENELPETLDRHTPGLYLSPRSKPGRVSSEDPLAAVDTQEIIAFMQSHPELADHRVVIGLPSLLQGGKVVKEIKAALADLNLPTDVEVIRWPNGSAVENLLDFFPRSQDWQKPLKEEIITGHYMVFGGEALSMSLMVYLVLTKQLSPLLGAATTVLDLAQQAIITYPIRFLSNYQRRQTYARQFLFNVIYGAFEATNFFLLLNSADLHAAMPKFYTTVIPGAFLSAIWSNTSVSAYRWEGSHKNRLTLEAKRIMRSNILLIEQIMLSPFYIYSVSPFAKTLFSLKAFGLDFMDVNVGHLVIIGAGIFAAASYPVMDHIANFTSWLAERPGPARACIRFLSSERGKKRTE